MKEFASLLAFLCAMLFLSAVAFVTIAITTGTSVRFWDDGVVPTEETQDVSLASSTEASPTELPPTVESTPAPKVEINFVFCHESPDAVELNSATCSPALIRSDSRVSVQMAKGDPVTIDGFEDVRTGFKVALDSGDTIIAVSIENDYFDPITFSGASLGLEDVQEPRTVYLPI